MATIKLANGCEIQASNKHGELSFLLELLGATGGSDGKAKPEDAEKGVITVVLPNGVRGHFGSRDAAMEFLTRNVEDGKPGDVKEATGAEKLVETIVKTATEDSKIDVSVIKPKKVNKRVADMTEEEKLQNRAYRRDYYHRCSAKAKALGNLMDAVNECRDAVKDTRRETETVVPVMETVTPATDKPVPDDVVTLRDRRIAELRERAARAGMAIVEPKA